MAYLKMIWLQQSLTVEGFMLKEIFYLHPNSNGVRSEKYEIISIDDFVYVVILGKPTCSLWNSDEARNLIFNEIVERELRLIPHSKIRLLVVLGELIEKKSLEFEAMTSKTGKVITDFERRIEPSQALLDNIVQILS
ncbi:TPA: hypothetical protein ACX6SJ_003873 [Photobacterium damselae]